MRKNRQTQDGNHARMTLLTSSCKKRSADPRPDKARQGRARRNMRKPRQGQTRPDKARQGQTRPDKARQGQTRPDKARQGQHTGQTRPDKARQGQTRPDKARQADKATHDTHTPRRHAHGAPVLDAVPVGPAASVEVSTPLIISVPDVVERAHVVYQDLEPQKWLVKTRFVTRFAFYNIVPNLIWATQRPSTIVS